MYAPVGPYREDLLPYQRATYDFFMPEKLRSELQRKAFATLQVMPSESNTRRQSSSARLLIGLDHEGPC
jgi:hypothetical protein